MCIRDRSQINETQDSPSERRRKGSQVIVGTARTGKTTFIIDSLKRSNPGGSLVVFDRQGEYNQALAGHRAQHARLFDLRGIGTPSGFNPLDLVRTDESLAFDVHELVTTMFESAGASEREYFNAKAIELISLSLIHI